MMPSKVAIYNEDYLLATKRTTADDNFDARHPFYQQIVELTKLYQQNPALRFGQQETLYAQNTPGLFVISREYQGQKLVIAFNTDTKAQQLSLKANNFKVLPLSLLHTANMDTKLQGHTISIAPLSFAIFNTK